MDWLAVFVFTVTHLYVPDFWRWRVHEKRFTKKEYQNYLNDVSASYNWLYVLKGDWYGTIWGIHYFISLITSFAYWNTGDNLENYNLVMGLYTSHLFISKLWPPIHFSRRNMMASSLLSLMASIVSIIIPIIVFQQQNINLSELFLPLTMILVTPWTLYLTILNAVMWRRDLNYRFL